MGRYDTLKINTKFLPILDAQELEDLTDIEFQTKDLEREFLDYEIGDDGYLYYEDFEYEMKATDNPESFFSVELKKINQKIKKSYYSGDIIFYGKPWDKMYYFKANLQNGKLERVDFINKE